MAVGQLPGIGKVSADVRSRTLLVECEGSAATAEAIRERLLGVGYESTTLP